MILNRIFGLEQRSTMLVTGAGVGQDATLKRVFGISDRTTSGQSVTEETALNFSAVYSAVRLLASIPGSLPKFVYRRDNESGDKEIDRKHPVARILHDRPNPINTPIEYEELIRSFVLLWGRSVSFIERNNAGQPIALWPMHPSEVYRSWKDAMPVYDVKNVRDHEKFPHPPFSRPTLFAHEVVDISSIDGKSVISRAREQIGEGLAAQAFGAGFYGGGAQPYVALKYPGVLSEQAVERLQANWQNRHGDATRRVAVLQEGMDVAEIGMPLDDAQFLDSRKFYVTEIARWFGVPPHKLADLERATFSNIEEQQLEFYEGLLPWFARFVQEFHYKLFNESERDRYLVDYMVEGLLKGNLAQRYQAYSTALQWGFMNRNEVRRKENLNSMGEDGDVFLVPVNMQPAEKVTEEPPEPEPPELSIPEGAPPEDDPEVEDPEEDAEDPEDSKKKAARSAMLAAVERMVAKEAADVRKAAAKCDTFLDWLDRYYRRHEDKLRGGLAAAAGSLDTASAIAAHCQEAKAALLALTDLRPAEFRAAVEAKIEEWQRVLPEKMTTTIMGE